MAYGFIYHKNCFFIEDGSGVLSDPEKLRSLLNNFQFETVEQYEQAIAFRHELNHYIQDLSVGSCLAEGYFNDYLASLANYLSKNDSIKFPLCDPSNREYNLKLHVIHEGQDLVETFYTMYDINDFYFKQKHKKPNDIIFKFNGEIDSKLNQFEMSYNDILEFYAFHKSYWEFFTTNEDAEHAKILHEIVKKNQLYPFEKGKDFDGFVINDFKKNFKWNSQYQSIVLLLLWGLPSRNMTLPYIDYCIKDIPLNFNSSPAILYQSQYRLIIETALHIPSVEYIWWNLKNGKYKKEDFSPVHRFYKIIQDIRDNKGYPDNKEGEESFFITFFDWIAEKNNWPTYEETIVSQASMIKDRSNTEAIVHFQKWALAHKLDSFGKIVLGSPVQILQDIGLPLILRTNGKLVIKKYYMFVMNDVKAPSDFYDVYLKKEVPRFTPFIPGVDRSKPDEMYSYQADVYCFEILERILQKAAVDSFVHKRYFSCPLYDQNCCPNRSIRCECFNDFRTVMKNCKKRIMYFNHSKIYLPNGGGDIEDCMFLNYMINHEFYINKYHNN